MKKIIFVLFLFYIFCGCSIIFPNKDVPKTIDECNLFLDRVLPEKVIKDIKNMSESSDVIKYHRDVGMWIRNNWGLWRKNTILYQLLIDLGKKHPDEMSHFILKNYYEYLQK